MNCHRCNKPTSGPVVFRCLCSGVQRWGPDDGSNALNLEEWHYLRELRGPKPDASSGRVDALRGSLAMPTLPLGADAAARATKAAEAQARANARAKA